MLWFHIPTTCIQFGVDVHLVEVKFEASIWPCDACAMNFHSSVWNDFLCLLRNDSPLYARYNMSAAVEKCVSFYNGLPKRALASNFVECNTPETLTRQHTKNTTMHSESMRFSSIFLPICLHRKASSFLNNNRKVDSVAQRLSGCLPSNAIRCCLSLFRNGLL